jgi:outer membrane murein-binding lipoprotein Lpp
MPTKAATIAKSHPQSSNTFFMVILVALIGSTLLSGGTAVMLATASSNQASVDVAALP